MVRSECVAEEEWLRPKNVLRDVEMKQAGQWDSGSQGFHSTERRRPDTRTAWHRVWPVRPRVLLPDGQAVHCVRPVVVEMKLTGQGVHTVGPSLEAKVPAGQARGVLVAGVGHWVPLGQRAQVPVRTLLV